MLRKIIKIDEEKCNGCGACAIACHEGAIAMINGKAKLIRDDYCDGMGDCLPNCPNGALSFEMRDAAAYDCNAVEQQKSQKSRASVQRGACPGSESRSIRAEALGTTKPSFSPSALQNWPPQIKLAPITAPYYQGARLLVAADCTAYAYAGLHADIMSGKVTLIGCPKLDGIDYSEKLADILKNNDIRSVTVARMEVPCCGGLEMAVKKALSASGKRIARKVITISIDGTIINERS